MDFEWDEAKNRQNIRKHGLDFNDAWEVLRAQCFLKHQDMSVRNLKKESKTDWAARIDRMTDDEIDFSDIPPLDDAFFERATKLLPRIRIDRIDLSEARKYAAYILNKKNWTHQKNNLAHDAFNTALIISYSRPFTTRYNLDEQRESLLEEHVAEVLTDENEIELHGRIKDLRDESYAHSDARSLLIPGMNYAKELCLMRKVLNLERREVELLMKMINNWIEYLDEQISLTKAPAFLIAPASDS